MDKVTKRELFTAIKTLIETGELPEEVGAVAVVEFCDREIGALDRRADKARERAAAKRETADELTEKVAAVLEDAEDFMTIAEVVERLAAEDPEITAGKIQYRLAALVKADRVVKEYKTIPASEEDGKARKAMAYKMV